MKETRSVSNDFVYSNSVMEAVVVTRSTPGPVGVYVVSVGYFVAGLPGAVAGWLAMATPTVLIFPLRHFAGRGVKHPRVKSVLQAVVIASAVVSLALLLTTKFDTLWIMRGAAVVSLSAISLGILARIQSQIRFTEISIERRCDLD